MSSSNIVLTDTPQADRIRQAEIEGRYKVFSRIIDLNTSQRVQLLNITDEINSIIRESGIQQGLVHIQTLHTTTSLAINEWQEALLEDILQALETMVPREQYWRHNDSKYSDCDRHNADSHVRGILLGSYLNIQVQDSAVLLGVWQRIIFAEFDGPRVRSISVQVTGV